MVISRSAGTSDTTRLPCASTLSTATFMCFSAGRYCDTGSDRRIFPASISISTATPVTGLVME